MVRECFFLLLTVKVEEFVSTITTKYKQKSLQRGRLLCNWLVCYADFNSGSCSSMLVINSKSKVYSSTAIASLRLTS